MSVYARALTTPYIYERDTAGKKGVHNKSGTVTPGSTRGMKNRVTEPLVRLAFSVTRPVGGIRNESCNRSLATSAKDCIFENCKNRILLRVTREIIKLRIIAWEKFKFKNFRIKYLGIRKLKNL